MRICHIWDADYPWDVRVEKVTRALSEAGHEVHIVARNKRADAEVEELEDATVHRLRPIANRRLNTATSFPAFFNPRWLSRINEVARAISADVLLVRDLPLAPAAIRIGKRLGIPVALDMAENYPAMVQAVWDAGRHHASDYLVRNPRLVRAVENWVLPRVDHTFVVIEESRDRLVAAGVPAERVTVVLNTPPRARLAEPSRDHTARGVFRLFYLGLLEAPRGIAELIRGVGIARSNGVKVELDLVGKGREDERFRSLAAELGLLDSGVSFHGFLPYTEGLAVMRQADVGVVPHYANESWSTTIPNKLFDYMSAGLPVLTSDVRPVARIVRDTGAGIVYRDRDVDDAARAIAELSDAGVRATLGRAARQAVADRYHWEWDAQRLTTALEHLVGTWRTRSTTVQKRP